MADGAELNHLHKIKCVNHVKVHTNRPNNKHWQIVVAPASCKGLTKKLVAEKYMFTNMIPKKILKTGSR